MKTQTESTWLDVGIVGPILQHPTAFFAEIVQNHELGQKISGMFIASTIFLTLYGAMLGLGNIRSSFYLAIAIPVLFLSSLIICLPVMYLSDVMTGSQRSLSQICAVLLTALTAASTVLFSFSLLVGLISLTGNFYRPFMLNTTVLGLAIFIGLTYMSRGILLTSQVDTTHHLSKVNQQIHLFWLILFLLVITQIAWGIVLKGYVMLQLSDVQSGHIPLFMKSLLGG